MEDDFDFPCSALFRGIDIDPPYKCIEFPFPTPTDEVWFGTAEDLRPKAPPLGWQKAKPISRGVDV